MPRKGEPFRYVHGGQGVTITVRITDEVMLPALVFLYLKGSDSDTPNTAAAYRAAVSVGYSYGGKASIECIDSEDWADYEPEQIAEAIGRGARFYGFDAAETARAREFYDLS